MLEKYIIRVHENPTSLYPTTGYALTGKTNGNNTWQMKRAETFDSPCHTPRHLLTFLIRRAMDNLRIL